jgi:hypothetical protein
MQFGIGLHLQGLLPSISGGHQLQAIELLGFRDVPL